MILVDERFSEEFGANMPLYAGNRRRVKEEERVSRTALRDDCHKYLPDVCDIFRPKKIEFLAFEEHTRLLVSVWRWS